MLEFTELMAQAETPIFNLIMVEIISCITQINIQLEELWDLGTLFWVKILPKIILKFKGKKLPILQKDLEIPTLREYSFFGYLIFNIDLQTVVFTLSNKLQSINRLFKTN